MKVLTPKSLPLSPVSQNQVPFRSAVPAALLFLLSLFVSGIFVIGMMPAGPDPAFGAATHFRFAPADTTAAAVPDSLPPPEAPALPDTLPAAAAPDGRPDFITNPDFDGAPGSAPAPAQQASAAGQEGGLTDVISFTARDSLVIRLDGRRTADLYGNARVAHPSGRLTAGAITLDLEKNLATAEARRLPVDTTDASALFRRWITRQGPFAAPVDTLSIPTLTRDGDEITSRRIMFNFVTEQGKFDVARVGIDQGTLTGTAVKAPTPHVVFIEDAIFSSCELDHPHYYIRARRMKMVDEEEVFFVGAQLYLLDIPYPVIFPFGYLPSRLQQRRSGLLEPSLVLQDQSTRGLGIENVGWFQYFNDYLTGSVRANVYTSGTFFADGTTNYALRGSYTGSVRIGYSRERGLESTDPDFSRTINRRLEINHQQTINPFANLSANINLRTADYFRRNSYDINERAETSTSSRASFNYRHPDGLYTLGVSMQQSQNFATNQVQFQGPNANYSFRRFNPFERRRGGSDQRWYETLSLSYGGQFSSRFNFTPLRDSQGEPISDINWFEALFSPSRYREATGELGHVRYGLSQRAELSTQLTTSEFLNITAGGRINEFWYPDTIRKDFNPETNRVEDRIEQGFTAARTFSTSMSFNTAVYGVSEARIGSFERFRHTMRPSVTFTYQPDFSSDFWGYFREVETDTLGNTRRYSIFERGVLGGPGAGEQRAISFSLSNILETKQVRRDSLGERNERNLRLIDNLNASLSYNFAAEQFRLSELNLTFSSNILQNIRINAGAAFNFYAQDSLGVAINEYLWENSGRFARLTRYNINASTTVSGGGRGGGPQIRPGPMYYPRFYDAFDQTMFRGIDPGFNQDPVPDFRVPWSASLRFTYSWRFVNFNNQVRSAVLNADNIMIQLTDGWRIRTSLGYDFIQKDLTPSRFGVDRNLHCWTMSFEWNPFGDFKFFLFSLRVNDSQMRSLFQALPGFDRLERRNSPIGRR
ncbi:MAG: LPS-assembly protein LptD [Candidatus Cyclonatronum sp.]|uniref:putative LPS assembly protein LptD n=1 Tax=Cyclonatronum sp. TaxID=3024185 RepID=UPI0025C3F03C|nr:putative LPS assembly protein LptD [Cyclonatronum sp.]MCH8486430.1 LPS-assembly protein LptD [Cyclonatronum sp.]